MKNRSGNPNRFSGRLRDLFDFPVKNPAVRGWVNDLCVGAVYFVLAVVTLLILLTIIVLMGGTEWEHLWNIYPVSSRIAGAIAGYIICVQAARKARTNGVEQ